MPRTTVILYQETDGSCPILDWLDRLPTKAQGECYLRMERLSESGHELRRPEADFLRDGIHELRISLRGVSRSVLFHGTVAAVAAHGIVKEGAVPPQEIERALERKRRFESAPGEHGFEE